MDGTEEKKQHMENSPECEDNTTENHGNKNSPKLTSKSKENRVSQDEITADTESRDRSKEKEPPQNSDNQIIEKVKVHSETKNNELENLSSQSEEIRDAYDEIKAAIEISLKEIQKPKTPENMDHQVIEKVKVHSDGTSVFVIKETNDDKFSTCSDDEICEPYTDAEIIELEADGEIDELEDNGMGEPQISIASGARESKIDAVRRPKQSRTCKDIKEKETSTEYTMRKRKKLRYEKVSSAWEEELEESSESEEDWGNNALDLRKQTRTTCSRNNKESKKTKRPLRQRKEIDNNSSSSDEETERAKFEANKLQCKKDATVDTTMTTRDTQGRMQTDLDNQIRGNVEKTGFSRKTWQILYNQTVQKGGDGSSTSEDETLLEGVYSDSESSEVEYDNARNLNTTFAPVAEEINTDGKQNTASAPKAEESHTEGKQNQIKGEIEANSTVPSETKKVHNENASRTFKDKKEKETSTEYTLRKRKKICYEKVSSSCEELDESSESETDWCNSASHSSDDLEESNNSDTALALVSEESNTKGKQKQSKGEDNLDDNTSTYMPIETKTLHNENASRQSGEDLGENNKVDDEPEQVKLTLKKCSVVIEATAIIKTPTKTTLESVQKDSDSSEEKPIKESAQKDLDNKALDQGKVHSDSDSDFAPDFADEPELEDSDNTISDNDYKLGAEKNNCIDKPEKDTEINPTSSDKTETKTEIGSTDRPKRKAAPESFDNDKPETTTEISSTGRSKQKEAPKSFDTEVLEKGDKPEKDLKISQTGSDKQEKYTEISSTGRPVRSKRKAAPKSSTSRPKRKAVPKSSAGSNKPVEKDAEIGPTLTGDDKPEKNTEISSTGRPKRKAAPKSFANEALEKGEIHTDEESDFEDKLTNDNETNSDSSCEETVKVNKFASKKRRVNKDMTAVKTKKKRKKRRNQKQYPPTFYPNIVCTVCGKELSYWYARHHMAIHEGKLDYVCNICGKAYAIVGSLTSHKRVRHSDHKSNPCSVCGKQFATDRYMRFHEYYAHKDKFPNADMTNVPDFRKFEKKRPETKQHNCMHCEKKYYWEWELRNHMSIHTGSPKYKCPICNSIFSKGSNLKRHHQTTHVANRQQFQCSYCEQRFTQDSSRKVHERRHTGEKSFSCAFCPEKFSQKSNKTSHEKRCKAKKSTMKLKRERAEEDQVAVIFLPDLIQLCLE